MYERDSRKMKPLEEVLNLREHSLPRAPLRHSS